MEKILSNKKNEIVGLVKGILFSLIFTVFAVFVLALVYKFVSLSDVFIKVANQTIKILSIALGVKIALKKNKSKGLPKGIIVGVLYTILSFLLFSLLAHSFSFSLSLMTDIIFAGLIGLIFGILFVNLKNKKF